MQKKIEFEQGNLIINYCNNSQNISFFETREDSEPIEIIFIPKNHITEKFCFEYTTEIMPEIINETKLILKKNSEFYNNFDIDFFSDFFGFISFKDGDAEIVCESWMRLNFKLKKRLSDK